MSIIGILTSNLFSQGAASNTQAAPNAQSAQPAFQQIKTEFQQLGQDLQSGNLAQAQQDYTTLSQNLLGANRPTASQAGANPLLQAFAQLGQDLQSGNLPAAQQDYTTVQQDGQQAVAQAHHGHHHHRAETSESASSQQANPISQAYNTLAQDLQAGNLAGAQSAFAALQSDLQQIGGFLQGGPNGGGSAAAIPASTGTLNVSA